MALVIPAVTLAGFGVMLGMLALIGGQGAAFINNGLEPALVVAAR